MVMKYIILLVTLTSFVGCNNKNLKEDIRLPNYEMNSGILVSNVLQANIGDYIYDGLGKRYKKVTNEEAGINGLSKIDVWERDIPQDKSHWYTPSLGSKIFTNNPPSFNSLFRLEGEVVPFF